MKVVVINGPDLDMESERAELVRMAGTHLGATVSLVPVSAVEVRLLVHDDTVDLAGLDEVLAELACAISPE